MTTASVPKIFAVPSTASDIAQGIVADRSGDLWFTLPRVGEVGVIDPITHVTTEYHDPMGLAPEQPTIDTADGSIWYTAPGGGSSNWLGRIDPKTRVLTDVIQFTSGGVLTPFFGNPAHTNIPIAGDYDGDGKTDIGIFDQTASPFVIAESGGGVLVPVFGNTKHVNVPVVGDYDGDGRTDIGVFDETNSQFLIADSAGGTPTSTLGNPADGILPVTDPSHRKG